MYLLVKALAFDLGLSEPWSSEGRSRGEESERGGSTWELRPRACRVREGGGRVSSRRELYREDNPPPAFLITPRGGSMDLIQAARPLSPRDPYACRNVSQRRGPMRSVMQTDRRGGPGVCPGREVPYTTRYPRSPAHGLCLHHANRCPRVRQLHHDQPSQRDLGPKPG
jgi:hypothetical protein